MKILSNHASIQKQILKSSKMMTIKRLPKSLEHSKNWVATQFTVEDNEHHMNSHQG